MQNFNDIYEVSSDYRLYDINLDFSTTEERSRMFAFQAALKVAADIPLAPWEYSNNDFDLVSEFLDKLEDELEKNLTSLESDYYEDYIFRLQHAMNIFVLGDQRFQELDNKTLKFILTGQINTTLDLIQSLKSQLHETNLLETFSDAPRLFESDNNEIRRLALEVDLIKARIAGEDEKKILDCLKSFFDAEKKDFEEHLLKFDLRYKKFESLKKELDKAKGVGIQDCECDECKSDLVVLKSDTEEQDTKK